MGKNRRWLNIVIALMLALSLVSPVAAQASEGGGAYAQASVTEATYQVRLTVNGLSGPILASADRTVAEGTTALELVKSALDANSIDYQVVDSQYGAYIQSIDGLAAGSLGGWDGWMYSVNGVSPNVGLGAFELNDGDEVVVYYSTWPAFSTTSEIEEAADNPTVTVDLKGDLFTNEAAQLSNWSFDAGTTALAAKGVTLVSDQQAVIAFEGTAKVGELSVTALSPAFAGKGSASLTVDIAATSQYHREKVEQALEKGKSYLLSNKELVSNRVNGSHSGFWMLSAMYAAGVDVSKYPWTTAPTSEDTYWTKALVNPTSASNDDAGTIIGSFILGLDPADVKSRNFVADLVAKQRDSGAFSSIWGESWAMVALDLVNAEYNQTAHINAILKMQNATTGYFGDLDGTGWILFALAPHRDQPEVEAAIQKAVESYHNSFMTKGFTDNANSMAAIISGLASVGEDLFSDKWTYKKDGETINIVSYLAEKYQLEDGGIRWLASQSTSNLMALEQVYIAFSDALHQKSTFERLKEISENPENPGTDPGNGNGGENPGTNPGEGGNPGNGNGNGGGSNENQTVSAYVSIQAGSSTVLASTKVDIAANGTAYDALLKVANANGISVQARMTSMGMYVEGINGLKEFDRGPLSGWMYRVNGEFPGYSSDSYTVKNGDRIEWVYTEDLGNDVGGGSPAGGGTDIVIDSKDGEWSAQVPAAVIEQKLKDDPSGKLVIEDKTGTKVEIPTASVSGAANVAVTIKNKDNEISVQIGLTNAAGQQLSYASGKGYVKVTIPVSDLDANTVVLAFVNGEYRAVPHQIIDGSLVVYAKTSGQYIISTAKPTFNDLDGVDNRDEIEYLAARQVIKGIDAETFNPSGDITRGQFAAMIARALGLLAEGESRFSDTAGKWYEQEIQALFEAGVINGTSATTFDPDAPVSRQQAAAMMARVLAYVNYAANGASGADYSDAESIRPEFIEAIQLLQALDIMTGKPDGSFDPDGKLTRAQMAKILKRTLHISGLM